MDDVATFLRERLNLAAPGPVDVQRGDVEAFDGFTRGRIEYRGLEGDRIPASCSPRPRAHRSAAW